MTNCPGNTDACCCYSKPTADSVGLPLLPLLPRLSAIYILPPSCHRAQRCSVITSRRQKHCLAHVCPLNIHECLSSMQKKKRFHALFIESRSNGATSDRRSTALPLPTFSLQFVQYAKLLFFLFPMKYDPALIFFFSIPVKHLVSIVLRSRQFGQNKISCLSL